MAVTSPPPLQTSRPPQWTPRQREVLDLLVKGRTNREIAETLGISLDGAKWHVSEIITRLGVDSREEAAEFWRHENGLRMRFTRIASGFSSGTFKWVAASAFVSAVVVVSAMVVFAMRDTGGEGTDHAGDGIETPAAGSPTPGATASPAPSETPSSTTVPNPTGETVAGVPVSGLVFGTPGSLPVPLSVIVEKGCYQCDGPTSGFERVTLDANGQLKVEKLNTPIPGYIFSQYWDPAGREHYLSVCSRGYCGGVGQVSSDAQTTVYQSKDGGVTWKSLATFDGPVSIATFTPAGPVLNRSVYSSGSAQYRFELLGTNQDLPMPAGATPEFVDARLIGWRLADGKTVQALDGTTLVVLPDVPMDQNSFRGIGIEGVLANGDILISWLNRSATNSLQTYIGVVRNGQLAEVFKGTGTLSVGNWLNQGVAFGNVTLPRADGSPTDAPIYPAMIDLSTGTVNVLELFGKLGSSAYDGQRNRIQLVEPGPFLRVTGAGDCLNVRENPSTSAKVIGCFADTVLLRDLAQEQSAGGVTWKKVQTPDGTPGWASAEFLAR